MLCLSGERDRPLCASSKPSQYSVFAGRDEIMRDMDLVRGQAKSDRIRITQEEFYRALSSFFLFFSLQVHKSIRIWVRKWEHKNAEDERIERISEINGGRKKDNCMRAKEKK